MKILFIGIYSKTNIRLGYAIDLKDINYFARNSVKEFLWFGSRMACEKTDIGTRQTVNVEAYEFHVYGRTDGLYGVVVTDSSYPVRVAYSLLNNVLEKYQMQEQKDELEFLKEYIIMFQDPTSVDKLMQLQCTVNETTVIMKKNLEQIIARGENLNDLMKKSADLSDSSIRFHDTARKNKCCKLN